MSTFQEGEKKADEREGGKKKKLSKVVTKTHEWTKVLECHIVVVFLLLVEALTLPSGHFGCVLKSRILWAAPLQTMFDYCTNSIWNPALQQSVLVHTHAMVFPASFLFINSKGHNRSNLVPPSPCECQLGSRL